MASEISSLVIGALFGIAVTASGIASSAVIKSQLQVNNYFLSQVYIVSSACSALLITVATSTGFIGSQTRSPSSYGLFGPYDGNIVGGLLMGIGMNLTLACPGTVLAQVGVGLESGIYAALGSALGGILYAAAMPKLQRMKRISSSRATTLQAMLGIPTFAVLVIYEGLCFLAYKAADTGGSSTKFTSSIWSTGYLPPIWGGVYIGAVQLASILIGGKTLGVSTAFEQFGQWIWYLLPWASSAGSRPSVTNLVFGVGIALGSYLAIIYGSLPSTPRQSLTNQDIQLLVMGGALMAFGSRLGGGCPAGHGISGLGTFSIPSFVTVAAMIGSAIGFESQKYRFGL